MDPKQLRAYFDDPDSAADWMRQIKIVDPRTGIKNLARIAAFDPTLEIACPFISQLSPLLCWTADPDMVLNNLERFFQATRSPMTLFSVFLKDRISLTTLLEIFATSQYLSDILIGEPELFEMLRQDEGLPRSQRQMTDELIGEVMALEKDASVLRALRRFKRRETLRIAYGDFAKKHSLEVVTRQISKVAEALIEAAIHVAGRKLYRKYGTPLSEQGKMAHFTVLALGKLGGRELNYSSDIDLMFLYDEEGRTNPDQRDPIANSEYFSGLGQEIVRLLTEQTELGAAYRVDMRLRPYGKYAPLAIGFDEAIRYYDHRGRTWERQAFIKARPVAGNLDLGRDFLKRLEPWVYRNYLTQADIAGIRTLKRQIERNSQEAGHELLNVKTGYGGIRDIEFMVQFLQLLHGGELPELRVGNTLKAIERLEQNGCLQPQERDLLVEGYRFLRKIEHRLQIMFDLQTHLMPDNPVERGKLALRMGYNDVSWQSATEGFNADFKFITNANRLMLNHLLVHAFHDDEEAAAEVDLLLDPEPEESRIQSVLAKYHFTDPIKAYRLLNDLMDEKNPYLSARRCRHFLAAIAPELLTAVSMTPKPDRTLATLATVSDALGGKGGLWELFSFNPPSLRLFVRLCAFAPFLTDMLCRDPGMLDGLMDSLVLDKIPPYRALDEYLDRLCDHAESVEPILSGFKNDRILPIGTRDILARSPISETTAALSDIAELCLKQVVIAEGRKLLQKHGSPSFVDPDSGANRLMPCRFAVVALGKFGGREMNYHSDLDLLFLYEAEGETRPVIFDELWKSLGPPRPKTDPCSNQEFFNKLAQGIVKRMTKFGSWGKLYDIDPRLRPLGKSGSLAVSLDSLSRYFYDGTGELWERQILCKARVVFSSDRLLPELTKFNSRGFDRVTMETVRDIRLSVPFVDRDVEQIRHMRKRLLDASSQDQLKRGAGGTVDVEFIVQMLQLKHGRERPGICVPNTFNAIGRLGAAGLISEADYRTLRDGYRFLRSLESYLCLMNHSSTKHLPGDGQDLKTLAMLAGCSSGEELVARFEETTRRIADCFNRHFV